MRLGQGKKRGHNGKKHFVIMKEMLYLTSLFSPLFDIQRNPYSFRYRYKAIVKFKTAFYSFYLPVALAMYMVSVSKNLDFFQV